MRSRSANADGRDRASGDQATPTLGCRRPGRDVQVYRRSFLPFVLAMACVHVPWTLVTTAVDLVTGQGDLSGSTPPLPVSAISILAFISLALLDVPVEALAGGLATVIAAETILGRPVGVAAAFRQVVRHFGGLLLADMLILLACFGLLITLLGIPVAIYLWLRWLLVFPIILLEGRGAREAMRRSRELGHWHRRRMFACTALIMLIQWTFTDAPAEVIRFVMSDWFTLAGDPTIVMLARGAEVVLQTVGIVLTGAVPSITTTLLYFDLRVRDEGFDLELRADGGTPSVE